MPEFNSTTTTNKKSSKPLIISIILIVTLMMLGYIIYDQKPKTVSFKLSPRPSLENNRASDSVILKVGKENIYQKDFDTELIYHPQNKDPKIREILLEKLIADSITLQAGNIENLIPLDKNIYNDPNKDYLKRIRSVELVRNGIEQQASKFEITIISAWFYNNNWIGTLGYEGGKKFALDKITSVYNQVKNNTMTIDQAGEILKKDNTLAQIDLAYQNNAISHVTTELNGQITLSKEIDKDLRSLQQGELSEIFLAQDVDYKTNETRDAVYLFGKVTSKTTNPEIETFETWLTNHKKNYEITYY